MPKAPVAKSSKPFVVPALGERERQFASIIWRRAGGIGRREIHQLTGVHPTLTGNAVGALIESGLVREGTPPPTTDRGRPQVPVEIDPKRRSFLGLSISPGQARLVRVDPTGEPIAEEISKRVARDARLIDAAANMLAENVDASVFGIGISFTGVVDPAAHAMLFSSSLPSSSAISLDPLYTAARGIPVVLHNDMHALALRWLMTDPTGGAGDVLLVGLDDGRLGASVLIDGKPHRGSVSAANELGHMRLAVETDRCYCGQVGCLERIVSTPQLARFGDRSGSSFEAALQSNVNGPLTTVLDHLTTGLANAVNFIRPAKLVLASPLVRHGALKDYIALELPPRVLPGLRERLELVFVEQPNVQSAENAAWLALADVFGQTMQTT